ncbi:hypothetical protein RSOLAG22IIIB_01018 [Rhizoctonia solani]|uniref:Uncharacterized protein n=1 Tax=Rhizoctonia solani TaxID=456999 RepID=A0A0K6G1I6_9AGAM|nr:unnamed protein product [Rhizoctonia solani]CUA72351.1 hypothetical protein RSOLAG22IIIB_01018 [Rhizoctonia solani]
MATPTTPHEHTPNSDSAGLSHTMSFFSADPHSMNSPPLDLHFPSRSHDSDSNGLDDFDTALFGHPNLVSFDSALGLQHTMLDPRRSILMSTPEHDILNPATNTIGDHQCTALRTQPGSQPRTMSGKQTDTSSPPLQLQFIIGPECSRLDNSPMHVPSAASLYQVVHPNVDDVIVNFDTKSKSFPRRTKAQCANQIDPFAEHFLRHRLGEAKWQTFSSRLFERRLGATRNRTRASRPRRLSDGSETHETKSTGASAVDFLVKVEVVKEVLRTFVPHPYNPIKSLSHPYSDAPSGSVTLTRSTVLALSGWSNTQFSYWARRAEAVSVLASHDDRLRSVANALERRLHPNTKFPDSPIEEEHVTGKGLDAIVDDVKKRTGASQFLRGKHSSLDPFSTVSPGADSSSDDADDVTQSPVTPHMGISSSSYPLLCSPGSPFHTRQSLPGDAYSPISATCSSPSSSSSPMFMLHDVDNLGLNGLGFGFESGVGNTSVGLNSANAIGLNDEPKRDWPGLPLSDERGVKRAWDDILQIGNGKRVRTEDENETGV